MISSGKEVSYEFHQFIRNVIDDYIKSKFDINGDGKYVNWRYRQSVDPFIGFTDFFLSRLKSTIYYSGIEYSNCNIDNELNQEHNKKLIPGYSPLSTIIYFIEDNNLIKDEYRSV